MNIFPSQVMTDDWAGTEKALIQDLDDMSLYQEFSAKNSAYVPQSPIITPESSTPNASMSDGATDESTPPTEATETATTSDTVTPETNTGETTEPTSTPTAETEEPTATPEEPTTVIPEEEAPSPQSSSYEEEASTEEVSLFDSAGSLFRGVFARVTRVFPFAQQSVTSTPLTAEGETDEEPDRMSSNETPAEEGAPSESETDIATSTSPDESDSAEEETTTATSATTSESVTEAPLTASTETATTSTTTATQPPTTQTATDPEPAALTTDATEAETSSSTLLAEGAPMQQISFTDFSTAELASGQFITGVQLRVSLAGQLEEPAEGAAPYIEVLYGSSTEMRTIGTILLEDEVSNALNGGYYLFALPQIMDVRELAGREVQLRYHGEAEALDGMYLDAVWIELNTKVVTREDIAARGRAAQLQHLKLPEITELKSDQLNFKRHETPSFNLRYSSQRNMLVRGFRSLLGRPLARVESVEMSHRSLGPSGIDPEVTVTEDGLISVRVPESATDRLRPGEYEVTLAINEGGYVSEDSFNFQWGILSINPNKTEYAVGETALLTMGALTPNGHTICRTDLDLYVTAPNGFISKVPVEESGKCDGNNVIDVPDFSAEYETSLPGEYSLYLERLDRDGNVLGFTSDSFFAVAGQQVSIERVGPTRIYPPAPYPMELTVAASEGFSGTLTERVPFDFVVSSTSATISEDGDWQVLEWDLSMLSGTKRTVSYTFDAPDISPYLYELGPAELTSEASVPAPASATATGTATDTPDMAAQAETTVFLEHRQWQIASDAVGGMMLLWDDGASIPAGWTCRSCGSGPFFQRFIMGSSSASTTGGSATHTHTADGTVLASSDSDAENFSSGSVAETSHTHTYTPTISTESNLPEYRQLRVIEYTDAAGEPPTIPAGAIGIFDVASSSLPSGWNRYAAQDGRYAYGEDTIGTTGGSNEHSHTITGTTGAAGGNTEGARGGTPAGSGAPAGHTHTVSSSTDTINKEPPYITVVLGQLSADAAPPNGLIAMWTEDVDNGWIDVSSSQGDPFNQRFFKASTTYGTTGGAVSHIHADETGVVSSGSSGTAVTTRTGAAGSAFTHTHNVDVTNISTENNLPPYQTAVFGRRQGTDPVYTQVSSRWFANENAEPPTDSWPTGAGALSEREPISATSSPVKNGEELRLRLNVGVSNATSTAGSRFRLQYAEAATVCSAATGWSTVGDSSSSTLWRGYDNSSVSDHATLSSTTLASTTVLETYEENGTATGTPNQLSVGDYGEWDFVLEHNGASPGTTYCFRMVEEDGSIFLSYDHYPQLFTNNSPNAPGLSTLFDNEKTPTTTPRFEFVATDPEGENIHYEIEVDDDYSFGTPVIDKDTLTDASQFENQVQSTEKEPFSSGELIAFSSETALNNGTTYYWRVRAQDPDGSGEWGAWSTTRSFTVDTSLTASAWFQTQDEQFATNALVGVTTGSDEVDLATGSTTGTMTSTAIDFDDGSVGTAWDSLVFADTETNGSISYQIEYLTDSATWALIPDSALTGNSTGFGTSPVSLLSLDTDTYNEIRVKATFTDSGGSPSLQDWQVNWGFRVETPTISKLFPNEQTGTTTPTFEFTTTDPQGDSLTYQVQWSTLPDFVSSTTRTSDDGTPGFVNIDAGADTDPFISGDTIQFTIQPANALSGTTTYWWRVRAKDTTGDNAYSFWTEPLSFTVIPGTEVSTWFQTTEEQFATNILSGTRALPTDAVAVATTATEAMLVYGEGTGNIPRYRQWDGTSWGSEGDLLTISAPLKWTVVRAGTQREEYVAATVGTDNDINAQVFSTGVWGNKKEMTINMGDISARGFDVAYESLSGDAMVAYCDATTGEAAYDIWNGSSWTGGGTITLASANPCEWIQLAADPTTDEIVILMRDSDGAQYEAQVWNGSSWGNSTTLGGIFEPDHEGMAVEYEESGGQALIIASDGNPARFTWDSWNGTAWAGASTQAIGDDFEWGTLVRDVGSDEMLLCYQDEDTDVGVVRWTGSAWTGQIELTVDGNAKNDPGFACVFEDSAGRDNYALTTFSTSSQSNYSFWNNSAWSTAASVATVGDSATMQLIRTGTAEILGLFFDDPNDRLLFSEWNGSSWTAETTLEDNASVDTTPYGRPYFMAPRNSGKKGTTIVSPGIDFTDGLGPYWETFSWNDAQPGTSEIRYRLQYQTATGSWAFIPDGDLPGNSAGTTTGPYDLSNLNTNTYSVIRPHAELSCDESDNCPELLDWKVEWAGGITISGTLNRYDQTTPVNSGSIAVAVNGVLQTGKVGSVSGGTWTIDNVTTFPGDVVTVFVNGTTSSAEAVGATRYDGQGDISGMALYERHLSLGSNDATTTPLTNSDIGAYDVTNDEDVFIDLSGTTLTVCGDVGCGDARLYISASTTYQPSGRLVTHDFENDGTFVAGSFTHEVTGSWENNATTTMGGSSVVFAATSSTESVDSNDAFADVTFGTTTGNATWTLTSTLDVNGDLTVARGTLARGLIDITVAGDLLTGANGFWSGKGTTTFDGGSGAIWSDQNVTLQNIGNAVIDGGSKIVTLGGNVAAESIRIETNDTLDTSPTGYDINVFGSWVNRNNFLPRSGEVRFVATSTGREITTGDDAFFDLAFLGAGGGWSFTEADISATGDITIATGTVTLPTGTTTVGGSFDATGGSFAHNNGTMLFNSGTTETITFAGGLFTNVAHNLTFNGGGNWTLADTNATATNVVRVSQGAVTFPGGVLAIGGTLIDDGGSFSGGGGTVRFYSSAAETITAGGSVFENLVFDGTGSWSFSDTTVDADGDLLVTSGTLTLPSGPFTLGGSYTNNATVVPNSGSVIFDSIDTDETVDFGNSSLNVVTFASPTGGWTIVAPATTTGDLTLATTSSFTLASGEVLSVGGTFRNRVGGASTTWTGSTLSLEGGSYSINEKDDAGDAYATLRVKAGAAVSMWSSVASTYDVDSAGSLYSQDHNAADGDLYVFGAYERTSGTEYWSYDTDFDGTLLGTSSARQVDVRLAAGASASFNDSTLSVHGASNASTTIANQGSGTYTVSVSGGTTTAQFYEFADLGTTGLSLLGGTVVPQFGSGSFEPAVAGGAGISLSSTTIDANPNKQIFNVRFATTTGISAFNVAQTDGTPTAYWWFRDGSGNLYGEQFDNDTGDPGSVRFDNSSLVLTISGTVYADGGTTPMGAPTCDDSTAVVRVVVDGDTSYSGSCSSADGSYSIPGVTVIGDPTLTVYLDNAPGGEQASAITRTPTADITDMDLYANRVIVRNEDEAALTIANLAVYDESDDADLRFAAATTTDPDSLIVRAGNELHVFASSTFTPGGEVTLRANAESNSYDGTLYLAGGAAFTTYATSTLTIGGRLELESGATLSAGSSTVLMNATTTGKSITSPSEVTLNELNFNGAGGGWNLGADIRVLGDMTITTGTVTGTGDITMVNGSLTGDGILSLGGGTTTLAAANTLGGTSDWTFYDLVLGSGATVGTTTPLFIGTTTVSGELVIANAHFFDARGSVWDLSGSGTVFTETGTFLEGTSTIRYSGAGASVLDAQYYDLDINAGAGSPTFTAIGMGLIVDGDLTVGGDAPTTFDLTANDPTLDVGGDLIIRSNGTLLASDSADLTLAGSYDNDGAFTGGGGTLTFDGAGSVTIAAGGSSFSNVRIDAAGDITVTERATTTGNWELLAHNSFTVSSGESLSVGGEFWNGVGGGATTWSGSTLRLMSGTLFTANAPTTSDSYGTLDIDGTTEVKLWNSDAATYDVESTAALYSQDHSNVTGDLYLWGTYRGTGESDFWSYARDFDGSDLGGGSERVVDVYLATSSSVVKTGGSLEVHGAAGATTTIAAQGSGSYGLRVGGSASTSWRYYAVRDIDSTGLTFSGSPSVATLSNGDLEVSQNGGSAMTVGGGVISVNPAKTFTQNRFALSGVASGVNVTATGTSDSSWRFTNHYGDLDGEANDVDPDGDPGYIAWDDSAALITVAGTVYSDEGSTVLPECNTGTNNITLRVAGLTSYPTDCDGTTGAYSVSGVSYSPGDSLVVYIDNETAVGATVSEDPISNINGLDIYENRIIVRHEGTDPLSIADMAVWDSSNDGDIPFTAVTGSPDTLTLPADTKLMVWTGKEFEPGGDVTLSGGGGGAAYDGTLELMSNADWTGVGAEELSIGGSMTLQNGATFEPGTGTTTFTTSAAGRTIDVNEENFYNLSFTGSGSWSASDPTLTVSGDTLLTAGTVTLPSGTTTVSGSYVTSGGAFDANGGVLVLDGTGTHSVSGDGSSFADLRITGAGDFTMTDTNATATASVVIAAGDLTLPSGSLAVGGDFRNEGGSISHNTSELILTSGSGGTLLASSSDLYAVTIAGTGSFTMADQSLTLLDTLTINSGSLTLATGTLSIGGSFDATGGTFAHASGTILFNSSDGGETIDPGSSSFYNVQIGAPTGGYTITGNATTTNLFTLAGASSFTVQSGVRLYVGGVFQNNVGGSATTWSGSTLVLNGANAYSLNGKTDAGDQYDTLIIGANSDLEAWFSAATTTTLDPNSSFYSMDHAGVDGALNIYGDYHIGTTTEYWSYATDFDGTTLSGSERAVTVSIESGATTTLNGGTLNIVGVSGNETTVQNQGSGTYDFNIHGGTFLAQYYAFRDLNATGLDLRFTPVISSLDNGDFELAVDSGTLISLSSTTLNANASLIINAVRFATTTAISGSNVTLTGTTPNAWTFVGETGNLAGEAYDVDGATECGSVRWDDSVCLLTQQTHYRWRNDDGGLGVPDSEWFNQNWGARQRVRLENADSTTYTDAVVELSVAYDADMQADFDDLRFTDSSGTTTIPHWIGSTTNSTVAEVWVKVPELPSKDTATIFMYYNHPTASSTSSSSATFIAADDFEDGTIAEYSGETGEFTVDGTYAWDGSNALDATGNESGRTDQGGIYDLSRSVAQGETIRFLQYIHGETTNNDEVCTTFGIQSSGAPASNYAVCTDLQGTERIVLARDVTDNADSGTVLASQSVDFTTGWYEVEVDWGTDDSIFVSFYDESGSLFATTSATDSSYSSGGIGFTFWFQNGGWDSLSSRPTLTTEPTVRFGAEAADGGASWAAALDAAATEFDPNDIARLRIAIENTGLPITDQEFLLEYAEQGASPSCEAVSPSSFAAVPVQSSCGSSPVCMQGSSNVTNGASTVDLLFETDGDFVAGEAREDPSNITGQLDLAQDTYTELEYVVTPTANVTDPNLCFRVTDNGTDYDTYLRVAKMNVRFEPSFGPVFFNNGDDISLTPGTTTRVFATSTVTDLNGYSDLVAGTSTMYTSSSSAACSADNNDCYIETTGGQCSFTDCAGNSCTLECYADIYFHANPTDNDGGLEWFAFLEAEDAQGDVGFNTSSGIELLTLRAIEVDTAIDYGALQANSDTGSQNASTTLQNTGNDAIDVEVEGTDLSDGAVSTIPASEQKFSTTTFTYAACAFCATVPTTTPTPLEVDLDKPTTDAPPVEDKVYWGIRVPIGTNSAPHQGTNIFYAVSDI